jgi:hypothetical protein
MKWSRDAERCGCRPERAGLDNIPFCGTAVFWWWRSNVTQRFWRFWMFCQKFCRYLSVHKHTRFVFLTAACLCCAQLCSIKLTFAVVCWSPSRVPVSHGTVLFVLAWFGFSAKETLTCYCPCSYCSCVLLNDAFSFFSVKCYMIGGK